MRINKLYLNPTKTEYMIINHPRRRKNGESLPQLSIKIEKLMTMEGNVNMEPECREHCPQQFLWGETLDPISLLFLSLRCLVSSYAMSGRGILSCSEGAEKASGKYGCNS